MRSTKIHGHTLAASFIIPAIYSLISLSSWTLSAQESFERPNEKREPVRLIDNIWSVGHSDFGAFLIATPEGLILMDPTSPEYVHWVVENIVNAGFRLGDIKYIINSHPHGPHVGGLAALQRLLPEAKIITTKETADVLATGGKSDFRNKLEPERAASQMFEPVKVDGYIGHQETLSLGGVTLTAHHTPGHTTGTTTWTMKVKDKGKQYDVVFMGGFAPSGHLLNNEYYPEIISDFENTFAYVKTLPCQVYLDTRAASMHLDEKLAILQKGDFKENPFVDSEGCRNHIIEYEDRFLKQLNEEKAAIGK